MFAYILKGNGKKRALRRFMIPLFFTVRKANALCIYYLSMSLSFDVDTLYPKTGHLSAGAGGALGRLLLHSVAVIRRDGCTTYSVCPSLSLRCNGVLRGNEDSL